MKIDIITPVGILGVVGLYLLIGAGSIASKTSASVVVYPIAQDEWGYSIVSSGTFVHAERGFSSEQIARDAASAYVKLNINPSPAS